MKYRVGGLLFFSLVAGVLSQELGVEEANQDLLVQTDTIDLKPLPFIVEQTTSIQATEDGIHVETDLKVAELPTSPPGHLKVLCDLALPKETKSWVWTSFDKYAGPVFANLKAGVSTSWATMTGAISSRIYPSEQECSVCRLFLVVWAENLSFVGDGALEAVKFLAIRIPLPWFDAWYWKDAVFTAEMEDGGLTGSAAFTTRLADGLVLMQDPWSSHRVTCATIQRMPEMTSAVKNRLQSALCRGENGTAAPSESYPCAVGGSIWRRVSNMLPGGAECRCSNAWCELRVGHMRNPRLMVDGLDPERIVSSASLESVMVDLSGYLNVPWVKLAIPLHLLMFIAGAVLLPTAGYLGESRLLHYFLFAMLGCTFFAVVAVYGVMHFGRKLVESIPGGVLAHNAAYFALLGPILSLMYQGAVIPIFRELLRFSWYFWQQGVLGYEWAGKAYFIAAGVLGMGILYWKNLLPAEKEEQDGEESWTWPSGRAIIKFCVQLTGLICLLECTSDVEAAMLLIFVILISGHVQHYSWLFMHHAFADETFHAGHMSAEDYRTLGEETTRIELERLKTFIRNNPGVIEKIPNELYATRTDMFARGTRDHVQARSY